jgi:hypothetical protein
VPSAANGSLDEAQTGSAPVKTLVDAATIPTDAISCAAERKAAVRRRRREVLVGYDRVAG